jgi:hypothetical protein
MNGFDGECSDPDATMTMLGRLLDGSVRGLAIYHLLKADLLMIRGLPEASGRPSGNRG